MWHLSRSRTVFFTLFIAIFSITAPVIGQTATEKSAVSVLFFDFDETTDPSLKWVRWGVSELLCYPLQDVPSIRLVERNRIKSLVDEMNLGQSGILNEADAITAGKWMGVQFNIFGSVMKTSATEVVILAKIVDVNTGEIIATEKVVGEKSAIQGPLIDLLAQKLIPHLTRRFIPPPVPANSEIPVTEIPLPPPSTDTPEISVTPQIIPEITAPPTAIPESPALPPASTPAISNLADALSHYLQAGYYYNLSNLELAIQEYQAAIQLDPNFIKAYIDLGVLYLQQNAFSVAETHFDQALSIDPRSELAHFNRGLLYGITGKLDPAINEFSQTLELNPNATAVMVELGKAYYKKQLYAQAKELFDRVIQQDPQYVAANYYAGVLYRRQNQLDLAAAQWQKVTENQEPFFKDVRQLAFKQSGELALLKKDFASAIANYTQALEQTQKQPIPEIQASIYCGLGKACFFHNQHDRAQAHLTSATDLTPANPEPHYYLGLVYQATKHFPEADSAFQKTIQCDPNGPFGNKAREILKRQEAAK